MLAQERAHVLIELLHLARHFFARQDPERLDKPEGKAAGKARQRLVALHRQKRLEQRRYPAVDEMLQAALHLFGHLRPGLLIHEGHDARLQRLGPLHQLAHGMFAPHQPALIGEIDLRIGGVVETVGAQAEFRLQRVMARLAQGLRRLRACRLVLDEAETLEPPHMLILDAHFAAFAHPGHEALLLFQPAHQNAGAPVNESLRQRAVQRIRQAVFYIAGLAAPMIFVIHPALALGNICPGADEGEAAREDIDIALGAVDAPHLAGEPVIGHPALLLQEGEDARQKGGVLAGGNAAEIRDAADIPQPPHISRPGHAIAHLGHGREVAQGLEIIRLAPPLQAGILRRGLERGDQRLGAGETKRPAAPLELADRSEAVLLDGGCERGIEGGGLARHPEGAGARVAARAPGDLADLMGQERAHPPAVKLGERGKGHVIDIEVEPHADRVRGHEVIHLAALIHRHLGIARARAERPRHHRRAALLAADQLGHRIEIFHRKPHDRRPPRHAADLARARIGKLREALGLVKPGLGHEIGDGAAHGGRAEKFRLEAAARVQQAIGEHMPALGIGAKLDFVDGEVVRADIGRHGLHRAGPVARAGRHDAFLARHQRHRPPAPLLAQTLIDLARQEAQRQADDPAPVGDHALDGVMGLAGIGGAEHGRDAPARARAAATGATGALTPLPAHRAAGTPRRRYPFACHPIPRDMYIRAPRPRSCAKAASPPRAPRACADGSPAPGAAPPAPLPHAPFPRGSRQGRRGRRNGGD